MDITEAHLSTKRISSRVAPAASAARMWRRVPSGLRLVQAAFNPMLTSSMNLRGRTPVTQGFVVIFTHVSAHCGSHWRSVFNARSHGPLVVALSSSAIISSPFVSFVAAAFLCPGAESSPIMEDWTPPNHGYDPQGEGVRSLQDAGRIGMACRHRLGQPPIGVIHEKPRLACGAVRRQAQVEE